ncbi:MAG: hypothetical protein JRE16_08195, partial [Deltaproteobacteria bacterium]|nr:hypothetical protein [Deltaproteobacteria bacterium]
MSIFLLIPPAISHSEDIALGFDRTLSVKVTKVRVVDLSEHEVTLVTGGQPIDMDWPDHVTLLPLPALFMDEKFTTLIAGDAEHSVEEIQRQRTA